MARMPKNNGDKIPLIHATVTIRGEPDTQPLTRVYYFDEGTDEQIFFNSMAIIKEKISNGMRININEVLLMYLDYFVQAFHSGKKVCDIINDASNILTADQVMIGVPESLREIKFALVAHNIPKQLFVLLKPIPTTPSALAFQ